MRKLLLASAALVVMSAPSFAASSLGFGGNFNFGNTRRMRLLSVARQLLVSRPRTTPRWALALPLKPRLAASRLVSALPSGSTGAASGAASVGNGIAGSNAGAVGGGAGLGIGVTTP